MYIRGLIPRNFAELAEAVPIVVAFGLELLVWPWRQVLRSKEKMPFYQRGYLRYWSAQLLVPILVTSNFHFGFVSYSSSIGLCSRGQTEIYGLFYTRMKVSKGATFRNRYNQVPHLTKDTNGK